LDDLLVRYPKAVPHFVVDKFVRAAVAVDELIRTAFLTNDVGTLLGG
jgi:hypothetical protein